MSEEKKLLRAELLRLRRDMDENDRKKSDETIYNNLKKLDAVKRCDKFLVYASSADEVDSRRFIDYSLAAGKTVAVPKCVGKDMVFLKISSLDTLVKSRFGVDEPISGDKITSFSDSVCIVPALGFDKNGFRLGWGGGFYDRFLVGYNGFSVGICYESCCGNVPKDEYDIAVDTVITENGIYK